MPQKKKESKKKGQKAPEKAPAKARAKKGRPLKAKPQAQPQPPASGGSIVGGGQSNASQGAAAAQNPQSAQSAVPAPGIPSPAQSQPIDLAQVPFALNAPHIPMQYQYPGAQLFPSYHPAQFPGSILGGGPNASHGAAPAQSSQPAQNVPPSQNLAPGIPGPGPAPNAPPGYPWMQQFPQMQNPFPMQYQNPMHQPFYSPAQMTAQIPSSDISFTGNSGPISGPISGVNTNKNDNINSNRRCGISTRQAQPVPAPVPVDRNRRRSVSPQNQNQNARPPARSGYPRRSPYQKSILSPSYQSSQSNPIQQLQSSVQSRHNSSVDLRSPSSASIPKRAQKPSDTIAQDSSDGMSDSEKVVACLDRMSQAFAKVRKRQTFASQELLDRIEKRIRQSEPPNIGNLLDAVADECGLISFEQIAPTNFSNEEIQEKLIKLGTKLLIVENPGLNDCPLRTLLYCFGIQVSPEAIRLLRLVLAEIVRDIPDIGSSVDVKRLQTPNCPVQFRYILVMMKFANACVVVLRVDAVGRLFKSTYDPRCYDLKYFEKYTSWTPPSTEPTRKHVLFTQVNSSKIHHVSNCDFLSDRFTVDRLVLSASQVPMQSDRDPALFQETYAEFETTVSEEKIDYFDKIADMKKENDLEGLQNLSDEIDLLLISLDTRLAAEQKSQEDKSDQLAKILKKEHEQAGARAINGFDQLAKNIWTADRETRINHCADLQTRKQLFEEAINDVRLELDTAVALLASSATSSNSSNIAAAANESPIFKPKKKVNRRNRKLKSQVDRKPDGFSQNSISSPEPEASKVELSTKRGRELSPEKSLKTHKLAESSGKSLVVQSPKKPSRKQIRKPSEDPTSGDGSSAIVAPSQQSSESSTSSRPKRKRAEQAGAASSGDTTAATRSGS